MISAERRGDDRGAMGEREVGQWRDNGWAMEGVRRGEDDA